MASTSISSGPSLNNSREPDVDFDPSGQTIDRYRLLRCLGNGGMGLVFEAEHILLEKRVAIKLLRPDYARHPVARRRFLLEAKAAARIKHANVVDISDFGETPDGQAFLVMEFLRGRDLNSQLKEQGVVPWARAQPMISQIVAALEAAHAQGVIHRDIKPANCYLVDPDGAATGDQVKVLDFGIAKVSNSAENMITKPGEIIGTIAYMAPEIIHGISDDPRSDIYSVGVTMYRMLVGELPFQGKTPLAMLSEHLNHPPPSPRRLQPSLHEGVEAIILKALAKRPEDRFATMADFARALQRGGLESAIVGPQPAPSSRPPSCTPTSRYTFEESSAPDTALKPPPPVSRPSAVRPSRWRWLALGLAILIALVALWVPRWRAPTVRPLVPAIGPEPSPSRWSEYTIVPPVSVEASALEPESPNTEASALPTPPPRSRRPRPAASRPQPRSDRQILDSIRKKITEQCKAGGQTLYTVSGLIKKDGNPISPNISPLDDRAVCIAAIVKTTRFSPNEELREMKRFRIAL